MNSPHFFLFSFIFIISLSAIAGSVSATSVSPNIELPDVDLPDPPDPDDWKFPSVSDIYDYFIEGITRGIKNFFNQITFYLEKFVTAYEKIWDVIIGESIGSSVSGSSIALIRAIATALIFILIIRFWTFILDVIPMI